MPTKIPFKISYPLEIFHPTREIDFCDKNVREELFKRNIYYYLFGKKRNEILERKHGLFLDMGKGVLDYMGREHPDLQVMGVSLFGSSSVLENPGDYDFLAITKGDVFLLDEPPITVQGSTFQTGISIKGVDNYIKGFRRNDGSNKSKRLEQIIDRTAISLFRRHIPLLGKDFLNNEREFLNNAHAQVSDLVNNAYELFYVGQREYSIPRQKRAKKLLTRCYEATSYLGAVDGDVKVQDMRKEIYLALKGRFELEKSKDIFERFGKMYEEKVSMLKPTDDL